MTKKEQVLKIMEIAKRAEKMDMLASDRLALIMDLRTAHERHNLKLDDFLQADDFNFTHDIVGIQNHIDRENGTMDNKFLPRFTAIK